MTVVLLPRFPNLPRPSLLRGLKHATLSHWLLPTPVASVKQNVLREWLITWKNTTDQ